MTPAQSMCIFGLFSELKLLTKPFQDTKNGIFEAVIRDALRRWKPEIPSNHDHDWFMWAICNEINKVAKQWHHHNENKYSDIWWHLKDSHSWWKFFPLTWYWVSFKGEKKKKKKESSHLQPLAILLWAVKRPCHLTSHIFSSPPQGALGNLRSTVLWV